MIEPLPRTRPKVEAGPLLEHSSPLLGGTEENSRDTFAPIKNGVKILPPTRRHLMLDSDEIVDALASHGVDEGLVDRL